MKQYFVILVISCSQFLKCILIHFCVSTKGDQDRKVVEGPQHLGRVLYGGETWLEIKVRKGEHFTKKEYFE